ncbi:MAG: SDR family oxidoreductase [Myxococcales bacterium FL481]|nr:MAG: SDR family oxidoreductase [Myxococcales bacterium FL481]
MAKPLLCPPELLQTDLTGRVLVVTGGNGGIGWVCVKQFAKQGATVVLACRRLEAGEQQAAEARRELPDAHIEVRRLDLADLSSVRAFAQEVLAAHDAIHGLLNNAGVMNTPAGKTADGFEMQLGTNHLGHFLLTKLLLPALKNGAPSRIVNVSSCFHDKAMGREGKIFFDDLNYKERKYDGWEAYAQSKLANLLHARGLAQRLEGSGVTAVSVHPGWVRTDLTRHSMPKFFAAIATPLLKLAGMIEPWEGAQTSLYAMLAPEVPDHPGEYYSQTGVYRDRSCNAGGWPLHSPNPAAHDDAAVDRLWDVSEHLIESASPA